MRGSGGRGRQGALCAACYPERHSPSTHSLSPAPAGAQLSSKLDLTESPSPPYTAAVLNLLLLALWVFLIS